MATEAGFISIFGPCTELFDLLYFSVFRNFWHKKNHASREILGIPWIFSVFCIAENWGLEYTVSLILYVSIFDFPMAVFPRFDTASSKFSVSSWK